MQRTAAATGLAREYSDVFELDGVPALRHFYDKGIFAWKAIYQGFYAPWHVLPAPTIASPGATRVACRMNAAKAVCAELAGLVWGETCGVRVSTAGWREQRGADGAILNPDPLNAFVQHVLRRNAFFENQQRLIEQALALGGAAVKVWAQERRGAPSASPEEGDFEIRLGYCAADQFVPLAWDSARVTEGVFISRRVKGRLRYTRLEWHRWADGAYVVENELYRAELQPGQAPGFRQDILGTRAPLAEAFEGLEERVELRAEDSLFAYWRTPVANSMEDGGPLGMSVFGGALETLRALDICYDSLVNEFRLGKKRIIVPARCVRTVTDPLTGEPRRYFDPRDEVYEAFASDDKDELKITDNSTQLRVEEHVAALNAFLSVLCLQLGFSASTFSFNNEGGLKTATEVVSENSKTYKTVRTVQNQLVPALERVVKNILDVAILYGMRWQGQSVERLAAGGYEVKVSFDDSIVQDRQSNLDEGVKLVGAGLLSKLTFLTDRRYGQGLTEAEALAELERIRGEEHGKERGE